MKLYAKVSWNDKKNARYLMNAFFKEFNPESSILIKGNNAELNVVFEEAPIAIVDAIGYCDIIEFRYSMSFEECLSQTKTLPEANETEAIPEAESQNEEPEAMPEAEEQEEEPETSVEETKEESVPEETPKEVVFLDKENGCMRIKAIDELAKEATSFEDFVSKVTEWLNLGKQSTFFKDIVNVSAQMEDISWNNIENVLKDKYNFTYNRNYCTSKVGKKLKEISSQNIRFLMIVKMIVSYKNYEFFTEKEPTEMQEVEHVENPQKENPVEDVQEGSSVEDIQEDIPESEPTKTECMSKTLSYEEILKSVDKTKPLADRVKHVLNAMGLQEKGSKTRNVILMITDVAMSQEKMDFENIFSKAGILTEELQNDARMTFAEFINEYFGKYDPGRKMKVLDFLKEMKEAII